MYMKKTLRYLFLLACALSAVLSAGAQSFTLSGRVVDEENKPVAGASIIVLQTGKGTSSTTDGTFSVPVTKGQKVEITYLGMEPQTIEVGSATNITVKLKATAEQIESVLVTIGYGQVAKKDISGSVAIVSPQELGKGLATNFSSALTGRMAGVRALTSEGAPGAGVSITIRGGNSLTGSNSPLWVIDGFPVDNPNTFSFDPNDIEQMQVLKDASATAIYGARGANGVIIIETKKGGTKDKVKVEYNGSISVSEVPKERMYKMLAGTDFLYVARAITAANSSTGSTAAFDDRYLVNDLYKRDYAGGPYTLDATGAKIPLTYANAADFEKIAIEDYATKYSSYMHDWQDEAFNTAITHSNRVAVSGGNQQTKYNISMAMVQQDGTLMKTGLDKYNFRINIDQKITKKLRLTTMTSYNRTLRHGLQSNEGSRNSILRDVLQYQPVNPVKYGQMDIDEVPEDVANDTGNLTYNPITNIKNTYREVFYDQLTINAALYYDIIKPLRFMSRGGYTLYNVRNDQYNNSKSRYGHPVLSTDGINASRAITERDSWFNENTLTFNKKSGLSRYTVLGGFTMQGYSGLYTYNKYVKFPTDILGINDLSQGTPQPVENSLEEWFLMSFLARAEYVYNDKYIATVSMRADGSSKFLGANKFSYFPSGALAWRVSQEEFLRSVDWVDNFKLRASWGRTGNNNIASRSAYGALYNDITIGYAFGGNYLRGYLPARLSNDRLKWETTEQIDLGADIAILGNRINITVDWYSKKTTDLLLYADLPPSSGYSKAQKNIGSVSNRGLEIGINTTNIQTDSFRWTTSFNISFNKNKVLGLNSGQSYMLTDPSWYFKYSQDQYIAAVGRPASMFYGYVFDGTYQVDDFYYVGGNYVAKEGVVKQVGSSKAVPGRIKYKDLNGDGVIDSNDMTVIGDPNPKHYGGFTNVFEYRNFDLSIFFTWSYGNDVLNANEAWFSNFESNRNNYLYKTIDYWSTVNPSNKVSAPSVQDYWVSSRSVENGSYLRVSNITLGYNLSSAEHPFFKKLGFENLRFYVSGDNLYLLTSYSGYDPEVSTASSALTLGLDYCSYPRSRTFTFGLDISF